MPKYNKTVWVNEETPLNADNLNNIEAGIESNESKIEANTSLLESLQTEFNEHKIDSVDKFNEIEDKIERSTIDKVSSLPEANEDTYNLNKIYEKDTYVSYIVKEIIKDNPKVLLGNEQLKEPIRDACCAIVGDYIYRFGGHRNTPYDNSIEKIDINTGVSELLEVTINGTSGLGHSTCQVVGNVIYIFGGGYDNGGYSDRYTPISTIYKFDTLTNTLHQITTASFPADNGSYSSGRSYMASALVGNYIYIIGGFYYYKVNYNSYSGSVNNIYKFNITNETLSTLSIRLPTALQSASATAVGTDIYIFGGSHDGTLTNEILKLNTITGIIEVLKVTLPTPLSFLNSVNINENIYIYGGGSNKIYRFCPTTEQLIELDVTLPTARTSICSATKDTNIYIIGGYNNSTVLQEYIKLEFGTTFTTKTLVTKDDLNSAHNDLVTKDELEDALSAYATESYVDNEISSQLNQKLSSKQDKLTAGTGISIVNNVISATNTGSTITGSGVEIIDITDLDTIPEEYQDFEKLQTCYLKDDSLIYHLSYGQRYFECINELTYRYIRIEDDFSIERQYQKELVTKDYIEVNPTDTATETLNTLKIDGTVYSLPQGGDGGVSLGEVYVEDETLVINTNTGVTAGTQVEANNGEETTDTLTSIKVDGINYALPQGGAGNVYIDGDTLYIGEGTCTGTDTEGCSNECVTVVEKIIMNPLEDSGEVLGFDLSEEELKKISDPSTFVLKLDMTYMGRRSDDSITNLTGVKVYFNDSITLDYEESISWNINFTCNNISYDTLHRGDVDIIGYYGDTESVSPYASGDGWTNPSYRCIEITGGDDVENEELIDWLYNNAIIVKSPIYLYTSKVIGVQETNEVLSYVNMFYGMASLSMFLGGGSSSDSGGILMIMTIGGLNSDTNTFTGFGMLTTVPLLTEEDLADKQDKLTAGTGITITDNVISATGGSSSEGGVTEDWVNQQIANQHQDLSDLFTLTNTSMFTLKHQHAHKVGPMVFVHITFTPVAAPSATGMFDFGTLSSKPLHNHSFALAAINESTGNVITEGATLKTDGTIVLHLTKSNASSNFLFDLSFFFCEDH